MVTESTTLALAAAVTVVPGSTIVLPAAVTVVTVGVFIAVVDEGNTPTAVQKRSAFANTVTAHLNRIAPYQHTTHVHTESRVEHQQHCTSCLYKHELPRGTVGLCKGTILRDIHYCLQRCKHKLAASN